VSLEQICTSLYFSYKSKSLYLDMVDFTGTVHIIQEYLTKKYDF